MAMRYFLFAIGILAVTLVVACRQPSNGQTPSGSVVPGGSASPGDNASPIAPAVEPSHPDAERTIPWPSSAAPVAPAVETDHPDAEQTIAPPSQPD